MAQSSLYQYNTDRLIVQGVYYVGKRRVYRRLASFAEAELDRKGKPLPGSDTKTRDALLDSRYAHHGRKLEREPVKVKAATRRFKDVWKEWLVYAQATRAADTVTNYRSTGNHLSKCWGDRMLMRSIDLKHVHKFEIWLAARGITPHTTNGHLNGLKAFLRFAKSRKEIADPPPVNVPRPPRTEPRLPEEGDVGRMIRWLTAQRATPEPAMPRFQIVHLLRGVVLARASGLRVGEIVSLPRANLDLRRRVINVRIVWGKFIPKERREKNPPLPPWAVAWLRTELAMVPAKERYVLDNGHGQRAYQQAHSFVNLIRKARVHAKAPGFQMHSLRRLVGTELIELGVDLQTVSEILGHSSVQVTAQAYAGRLTARTRAAMDRLPPPEGLLTPPLTQSVAGV